MTALYFPNINLKYELLVFDQQWTHARVACQIKCSHSDTIIFIFLKILYFLKKKEV
jgi:hypothetical protein